MLLRLGGDTWDETLLTSFGVDPAHLPALADAAEVAGGLTTRGVALTGLRPGLPVAVGTGDDFSSVLGAGIATPGIVGVTLGTAEIVCALADQPCLDEAMLVETHAFPGGRYHLGNPGWLSGGAVRWLASLLCCAADADISTLAAAAPPGADGLLFIPALSGAMAPRWVASARGAFYGLSASHDRPQLARAVLEGTALAMRDVIERLRELGLPLERIRLTGGGAASREWAQIRADVAGLPVDRLVGHDASAMGAALLAAVAAGAHPDVAAATRALPLSLDPVEPNADRSGVYDAAYGRYRRLFDALEPMFDTGAGHIG
jgi:xylulokinase